MNRVFLTVGLSALGCLIGAVVAMGRYMDTIPLANQEDRERAFYVALRVGVGSAVGSSAALFGVFALQGDSTLSPAKLRRYARKQALLDPARALDWEAIASELEALDPKQR